MEKKKDNIEIKKKNEGKFREFAKQHGKTSMEMADYVLSHKKDFTASRIKQANFARNFGK